MKGCSEVFQTLLCIEHTLLPLLFFIGDVLQPSDDLHGLLWTCSNSFMSVLCYEYKDCRKFGGGKSACKQSQNWHSYNHGSSDDPTYSTVVLTVGDPDSLQAAVLTTAV